MKGPTLFTCLLLLTTTTASSWLEHTCPPQNSGKLLLHEDCDKFYKCAFGEPVEFSCAPGLHFGLEKGMCDWPRLVDCGDRNLPSLSTTTSTSTTTSAPLLSTDFRPNGCPLDTSIHWLLRHEADCNLFYQCVWGINVLRHCPFGLHFDSRIQVCNWPSDAGCTISSM